MNPYFNSDKLGWEMVQLDEDLSYQYNTLAFWRTQDGVVLTASDRGCSCPMPFEDYEGECALAIEQGLERVGSLAQAEQIIEAWNKYYDKYYEQALRGRLVVPHGEVACVVETLKVWGLA